MSKWKGDVLERPDIVRRTERLLAITKRIDDTNEKLADALADAGDELIAAKEALDKTPDRTAWTRWLKLHVHYEPQRAREYMSLARLRKKTPSARRFFKIDKCRLIRIASVPDHILKTLKPDTLLKIPGTTKQKPLEQMFLPNTYTERLLKYVAPASQVRAAEVDYYYYIIWKKHRQQFCWGERPHLLDHIPSLTARILQTYENHIKRESPLNEARRYVEVLSLPSVKTKAQAANRLGVSRARVIQILNLLKLPEPIITFLHTHRNNPAILKYFTEKRLRSLTYLSDQEKQTALFKKMVEEAVGQAGIWQIPCERLS